MEKRELGRGGLKIYPLVFGGNVFGWTVDEKNSMKLLDAFAEAGGDCVDTADVYPNWVPGSKGGESEAMIGRWLKLRRNRRKIVLATKVGGEMGPGKKGLTRAYILKAAEASLKRLQTDYIDLYQAHRDDVTTPLEETLEAFGRLLKQGKVRFIGASNYTAARLSSSFRVSDECGLTGYSSLQTLYNLYDRAEYETGLEGLCRERGLGVLCYYSLASGYLSGKYRSAKDLAKSRRADRVKGYMNERGGRILGALDRVAAAKRSTPASVALAWLLARPGITAPIASATSVKQVAAMMKAARLKLDPDSMKALERASAYAIELAAVR